MLTTVILSGCLYPSGKESAKVIGKKIQECSKSISLSEKTYPFSEISNTSENVEPVSQLSVSLLERSLQNLTW